MSIFSQHNHGAHNLRTLSSCAGDACIIVMLGTVQLSTIIETASSLLCKEKTSVILYSKQLSLVTL